MEEKLSPLHFLQQISSISMDGSMDFLNNCIMLYFFFLHFITIKTMQYTALLFSVGVGFNRNIKPRHGLKTEQIFGRDFIFYNEFSNKIKHKFG